MVGRTTTIALDTNIWIYLVNDNLHELWLKFKEKKEKGEIIIITNEIIHLEWERNKSRIIKSLTDNIKNEYRSSVNLSNYLPEDERKKYLDIVSQYKEQDFRIKKATERVEEIEAFMKSCVKVAITDIQKLDVSELAIRKLPPFHCNKNNYNDALLLINFCQYVEKESSLPFYNLIYVSNNPKDFTNPDTNEIYTHLIKKNPNIRFKNVTELAVALDLTDEHTSEFEEWMELQLEKEAKNLALNNIYDYQTTNS